MVVLRKIVGTALWLADEILDQIPAYGDWGDGRRWHRYGQFGCQLGLGKIWASLS